MAHDPPPLALSDIMHPFTPSPSQDEDGEDPPSRAHSATPEPLDQAQIDAVKSRLLELGISSSNASNISFREQELGGMVLKLANSRRLDPSQLVAQAEAIHQLTQQRGIMLKEVEEERARWEAERLGWARMAEALLVKRRAATDSFQQEELDRQMATLEADNKSLRQRLSETQARLTTFESELMRLRPLLMLQPIALSSLSNIQQLAQVTELKQPSRRSYRKKDPAKEKERYGGAVESDEELDELADEEDSTETPKQKQLIRMTKPQKGKARGSKDKSTPLMADARAEHMLLAARKLGRERVGYVSGLIAQQMGEERDDFPSTLTPRTPRRSSTHVHLHSQPHIPANAYVYVSSPAGPSTGVPILVPIAPGTWPVPRTPMSPHKSAQRGPSRTTNAQTPLDSLVSAARSILDDDRSPSTSSGKRARKMAVQESDTPVPKRKKVSAAGQDSLRKGSSSLGRVRSALDVLADQAAVFSSQEKEKDDSAELSIDELAAGKGKGVADGSKPGRRRSARTRRLNAELPPGESRDSDSLPGEFSNSVVLPPTRSPSRTPPRRSSAEPVSLAPAAALDPRSPSQSPHMSGFVSPPPDSPEIAQYRHPLPTLTPRSPPLPGFDQINTGFYTNEAGEVISVSLTPGYSPGYGFIGSPPNAEYMSQRGGARMMMDFGGNGGMSVKKKRADDKRAKTPYKKWSKEEDEVLAQAVGKYGQKWDQVQKALPERGYHQVRQRWLRRLRSIDNTRMALENVGGAGTSAPLSGNEGAESVAAPNPKLGLAPLSSELAVAAAGGFSNPSYAGGDGQQPVIP